MIIEVVIMSWENAIKKTTFEGEEILKEVLLTVNKAIVESMRNNKLIDQYKMLVKIRDEIDRYISGTLENKWRDQFRDD